MLQAADQNRRGYETPLTLKCEDAAPEGFLSSSKEIDATQYKGTSVERHLVIAVIKENNFNL